MKKYSKSFLLILLPVFLSLFNGKCTNILALLFYIPCEVPSTIDFNSSSQYHNYYATVYVSGSGGVYLSFDYCNDPGIVYTAPGSPSLNCVIKGFWGSYNIVVGNGGTIVRSSTTDTTWRIIASPRARNLNKVTLTPISAFNDYLVAVGDSGTVISSRDFGNTWFMKSFPYNINLRDVEIRGGDTNNIRVVGDGLSAYFTTNGGVTWVDDSLNLGLVEMYPGIDMSSGGPNLNTIQYVNANTGYIAGQNGMFFKTVNGGGFYFPRFIQGINNITDLYFFSPDSGFVIGQNGIIKVTDNGGLNWYEDPQITGIVNSRQLNSISVIAPGYGYINGSGGFLALVARDSSIIGFENNSTIIPKEHVLMQNYPNPFNPVTNISFSIPNAAVIRLTVYDVLGKVSGVLVNERLNAGSYNFKWNAENYPSGVYFYALESGEFTSTKKMMLIK